MKNKIIRGVVISVAANLKIKLIISVEITTESPGVSEDALRRIIAKLIITAGIKKAKEIEIIIRIRRIK